MTYSYYDAGITGLLLLTVFGSVYCEPVVSPQCGIQQFTDRIVNGNLTTIDEYPWLALLRYRHPQTKKEKWGCGGSLIGTRTILTAAHCFDGGLNNKLGEILFVRLGEHNVDTEIDCTDDMDCADPPRDFKVKNIIIHPDRNINTKEHDIALLILEEVPPYTDFIRPICLPETKVENDMNLFVAGWGSTSGDPRSLTQSNVKLQARLPIVENNVCQRIYKPLSISENSQICAGGIMGVNACFGDSGGPLMEGNRHTWSVVGLVSFGPEICGIKNRITAPTVFTNISHYTDWLEQNVK